MLRSARGRINYAIRLARGRWVVMWHGLKAQRLEIRGLAPKILNNGRIGIGDHAHLRAIVRPIFISTGPNAEIKIGDSVFINEGVSISAELSVNIGKNCKIGDNASIADSAYHQVGEGDHVRVQPVEIGDNVWIGRSAIILPGVTIGDHSVIGAGSVVTRSVPPRTIVAGNPARTIRTIDCSPSFVRD